MLKPTKQELLKRYADNDRKRVERFHQFDGWRLDGWDDVMRPDDEGDALTGGDVGGTYELSASSPPVRVLIHEATSKADAVRLLHKIAGWVEHEPPKRFGVTSDADTQLRAIAEMLDDRRVPKMDGRPDDVAWRIEYLLKAELGGGADKGKDQGLPRLGMTAGQCGECGATFVSNKAFAEHMSAHLREANTRTRRINAAAEATSRRPVAAGHVDDDDDLPF